MKIKSEKALAGIDMIIAIIAISIFSTIIVTMMYNNTMENVKLKKESIAMIYMTEIFEKIGIESYDNVTEENVANFLPEGFSNEYKINVNIEKDFDDIDNSENIMKKVNVTITYKVADKEYSYSMQRIKAKE